MPRGNADCLERKGFDHEPLIFRNETEAALMLRLERHVQKTTVIVSEEQFRLLASQP